MAGLERLLWYLNCIATIALLMRLIQCKLGRTYRSLFLYWLVQAVSNLLMLPIPLKSRLYAQLYYASQTVSLVLAIFVVLELYREALAPNSALAVFGRRSLLVLMGIAALMAAFGVMLDATIRPGQFPTDHWFLTLERTFSFMLLAFLLLISGFLLWFPVKVKRNVVVYMVGFVLFYSSRSVGLLLANLLPHTFYQPMSNILLGFSLMCLLLWLVGLRPEGEDVITVTGNAGHAPALARLSAQLNEINTALVRFVRSER
jgi:hypothetical protein